jgi:hypothetical protein
LVKKFIVIIQVIVFGQGAWLGIGAPNSADMMGMFGNF